MLGDTVEAAEAITFRTETGIKKGRKYEKKVAVALWPQGEGSMRRPHASSFQCEDSYLQHDVGMMPDSVPNVTPRSRKVRIYRNSIPLMDN